MVPGRSWRRGGGGEHVHLEGRVGSGSGWRTPGRVTSTRKGGLAESPFAGTRSGAGRSSNLGRVRVPPLHTPRLVVRELGQADRSAVERLLGGDRERWLRWT